MNTAMLLLEERRDIAEDCFVELVVWKLPHPVRASKHLFKYRLALVISGSCVLRYDNEAGKGDHKHVGTLEIPCAFSTPEQLYADFMADVTNWRA